MNNIYDNGDLMIGNIKDIINYIENDENLETWEYDDLLKDLKEIENIAYIVMVNYDNPMGYSIDYWTKDDEIKKELKNINLLKVYQAKAEDPNYLVYCLDNGDNYEVYLQNKEYGSMMFCYGATKKQQTLEYLIMVFNDRIDSYIEEYQERYED